MLSAGSGVGLGLYARDTETGALSPLNTIDVLRTASQWQFPHTRFTLSSDGTRVYSSVISADLFGVSRRNSETGLLTREEYVPLGATLGLGQESALAHNIIGAAVSNNHRHVYLAHLIQSGPGVTDGISFFDHNVRLGVFDRTTQSLRSRRPLATRVSVANERAVFLTPEPFEGADLNGDGDQMDDVAFLYDVVDTNDTLIPLGLAARRISISDEIVALAVPEADQAGNDLNDDGDAADDILFIYEIGSGVGASNTGLAVAEFTALGSDVVFSRTLPYPDHRSLEIYHHVPGTDGSLTEIQAARVTDFVARGSSLAFRVIDLDQTEPVLIMHAYDMETNKVIDTGLSAEYCYVRECKPGSPYTVDETRQAISFLSDESVLGNDLDGDGSADDVVTVVLSTASFKYQVLGATDDTGSTLTSIEDFLPPLETQIGDSAIIYRRVVESEMGEDLNGDGIIDDSIVVVVIGDTDNDGTYDDFDTCSNRPNPEQLDLDGDLLGDWSCDPDASPCPPTPLHGCFQSISTRGGKLSLKRGKTPDKNKLRWSFRKGEANTLDTFGDPANGSNRVSLCIYDDESIGSKRIPDGTVAPGGMCDNRPCWKPIRSRGLRFKSKTGSATGVRSLRLIAGESGKPSIKLKSKGPGLVPLALPMSGLVTAQFVVNHPDGGGIRSCWETSFATARRNDDRSYKAVSD